MTPAHNFAMLVLPKEGIKRRKEDERFTVIQQRAGFFNNVKILHVPVPGFPVNIALRELVRVSSSSTVALERFIYIIYIYIYIYIYICLGSLRPLDVKGFGFFLVLC
jgi:hypothetical protein